MRELIGDGFEAEFEELTSEWRREIVERGSMAEAFGFFFEGGQAE